MTKAGLIKTWQNELMNNSIAITIDRANLVLKTLCDVIRAELSEAGSEISLPGIGKLKTVRQSERKGCNPRTGQAINVPARKKVKFAEGKKLKDALKS